MVSTEQTRHPVDPRRSSRIYLTGVMGCGKSTVAPHLSGILGFTCFDMDAEIEKRTGRTVGAIFTREGERFFRTVEREVLLETNSAQSVVVALGGGTIAGGENLAFVKSAGVLVYLREEFGVLFERLRLKTDRPLLAPRAGANAGDDALRATMLRLLAEREPHYLKADIVVTPDHAGPERTAAAIAAALRRPARPGLT
jgi:shikimate kinase